MTLDLKAAQAASDRYEQRQDLIDRVEEGLMAPETAEQEALQLGLSPLARDADRSKFPVSSLPAWSPLMALAWILWRDYEIVTDFYDEYRAECLYWKKVEPKQTMPPTPTALLPPTKHFLRPLPTATFNNLKLRMDRETRNARHSFVPDIATAQAILSSKLYEGKIAANGIRATTEDYERIEPEAWAILEFEKTLRNGKFVQAHRPGEAYYTKVYLSREHIEREWAAQMTVPVQAQETPGAPLSQRPAGKQQVRDAFHAASHFFRSRGFLMWSKDEAETDLPKLLNASRNHIREVFAEDDFKKLFSGGRGKRGPVNQNRNNELAEFRQFFASANMRK